MQVSNSSAKWFMSKNDVFVKFSGKKYLLGLRRAEFDWFTCSIEIILAQATFRAGPGVKCMKNAHHLTGATEPAILVHGQLAYRGTVTRGR